MVQYGKRLRAMDLFATQSYYERCHLEEKKRLFAIEMMKDKMHLFCSHVV